MTQIKPRIELALIAVFFAVMFAPFMASLVDAWNNRPDASHGWIVLPLAVWLAWKKKDGVLAAPQKSYTPALALVFAGLLAAIIATRASLESVGRIALVLTLNGLLLYLLGIARYRIIAFPALFLFLMVPVPVTITGAVTFPLQLFASAASELAIALVGIPVLRTGNVLEVPGGKLEVAEACSGLRSAMTFVTLGVLMAWVTERPWKKIVVALLAVPFALLANIIRITGTAILVHFFGPSAAEGTAHEAVGIGSFLIGLLLYALSARALGSRWSAV